MKHINFTKKLIMLLIFTTTLMTQSGMGQTTVFSDDFSSNQSATWTTSGQIGSSDWYVSRSGADWGARRNTSPAQLELTNDASGTANVNGWVFAYVDASDFSSPYNTTLSSNMGLITWTFNMRQIRTDPGGFGAGSYGVAFILAGSSTTANNTGNGYAIVLGQSGTTDPIRLAKYNNGLQGTLTNIITSNTTGLTDFGAEYLSIMVTYDPSNNGWELFLRNDGASAFADPASGTLTSQGTATDNTYTSSALSYTGAYWQGSTGANLTAFFDNVKVTAESTPTISVNPTTLTGLSYNVGSGPSTDQSFTISGSNLTNNISITPPTNYEISTGTGVSFSATNPITLTQSGGTVSSTTIYVRLKSGLSVGNYNSENITASSTGATNSTVTCSGSVVSAICGTETFANLTAGSSFVDGTFTGQDGSTWTHVQCRGDSVISGKAIMIGRNQTPQSNFYSGTISGGIGILNFDFKKVFTNDVNLDVYVNDLRVGNVTSTDLGVVKNSGDIGVHIDGDIVIKFINRNNSDGQVVIDNVSWTCYEPTYYRSAGNGNWNNPATWEISDDKTTWVNAVVFPDFSSDTITIRNGHSVTITEKVSIDQTIIESGGTLIVTDTTYIINRTGDELIIQGTLLNQDILLFIEAGTWRLDSGATYIHNNTKPVGATIDILTINENSTFIYRNSGTAVSLAGRTYGNLRFENASGPWSNNFSGSFPLTVLGDFFIDNGVTLNITHSGANTFHGNFTVNGTISNSTNVQHMRFAGNNVNITGSGTFDFENATIMSGATVTSDYKLTVTGNLAIESTGKFLIDASRQLTVEGNITNNGELTLKSNATDGTATILTGGTMSGTGSFNVQQHLTDGRNWYITPPVSGATSSAFDAAGSNQMWSFNETGTEGSSWWTEITNNTTGLNQMYGYIANVGTEQAYTFSGSSFGNGNMGVTNLSRTAANPKQGYHLIGNPYPSYLNPGASAFASNVETTIWYRTHTGSAYVFRTFNYTVGIGQTGVTANIPPNQSFWVRVTEDGNNSLQFTNAMRSHNTGSDSTLRGNSTNNILRMFIENFSNPKDETIIVFNDQAGTGFNAWDSEKQVSGGMPQIWSLESGRQLVINSMPEITNGLIIPLYMNIPTAGNHTISFNLDDFDQTTTVWLQDLSLGNMHDIRTGDYNFTSSVVSNNNRFLLMFDNVITGSETITTSSPLTIYSNEDVIYVNTPKSGLIEVWDITGRLVAAMDAMPGLNTLNIPVTNGVYIVSVASGSQIKTAKVVLWNK